MAIVNKFNVNSEQVTLNVIYDVTTNNYGTTFESLQSLLSSPDLDTLIPTSVRYGGMSIRFVQSSDNKYIQARCMAQNFTTDVTQWQGVDDEPTPNSKNLAESGGIESAIFKVDRQFDYKETVNNGFPVVNGWVFDGGNHIVIEVAPNDIVKIYKNDVNNTYFYVLKDYTPPVSGDTPNYSSTMSTRQQATLEFTVPDDAHFIVISNIGANTNDYSPSKIEVNGQNITQGVYTRLERVENLLFKTFNVDTYYMAGEFIKNPVDNKVYKLLQEHLEGVSLNSIKRVEFMIENIFAEVSAYMSQLINKPFTLFNSKMLGFVKASINSGGYYDFSTSTSTWIANIIPIKGNAVEVISLKLKNDLRGYLCARKYDGTFSRTELTINSLHEIITDVSTDYYLSVRYDGTTSIDISDCSDIELKVTTRGSVEDYTFCVHENNFNNISLWESGLYNSEGSITTDARFIRTHLISSCGIEKLNITLDSDYSGYVCFFNASGTMTSRMAIAGGNSVVSINAPYYAITFKKTDNSNITVETAYNRISWTLFNKANDYVEGINSSYTTSLRTVADSYKDDWKFSWITGTGIPTKKVYPTENQLSSPFAITAKKGSIFSVVSGYKFKLYIIDTKWNILTFTSWIETGSYTFTDDSIFLFSIRSIDTALDTFENLANACLYRWAYEDVIVNQPVLTSVSNPFFFEAMDCVEKLEDECDEKSIVIGFVTDSHYNGSHTYNDNLAKYWGETAKNIKLVNSLYPMDMIVHGGDITDGYWAKADTISLLKDVRDSLIGIGPMNPIMLGNHDSNYPDNIEPSQAASRLITKGEFYSRMSRYIETKVVRVEDKMYYYIDFDTLKLRFVFIDANITPNIYNMSDRRSWGYDTDQISWVQNTALDTNYQVVFFSHMGVSPEFNDLDGSDSWPVNGTSLRNVIEAFISNGGVVVGFFHGHTHWDFIGKHSVSNGFYEVSTCCQKVYDNATWNVEYLEEHYSYVVPEGLTIPTRIGGEVSQDCWDIIVIHPNSRKVKIIRFGAGNDREISY